MILTPNQMAKAENYAVSKGTSLAMLMENSGYELSKAIKNYAYKYFKKKVLILCGNGNNGGDGFVCANHLSNFGLEVSVALICGLPKTELSINAFKGLTKDITITTSDFNSLIFDADIIADCVFGTGFHGDLSAETVEIFKMVSNSKAYKFACDIPSGINCLTGVVSKGTISCDKTITFHGLKLGAIFNNSKGFCGDISISDIGIPSQSQKYCDFNITHADESYPALVLPKRDIGGHKGTFGKLLAICGSNEYRGAGLLSISSAIRSGVGIVELFSPRDVINGMWANAPEAIYTETDDLTAHELTNLIIEKSKKATAILIGCGISCNSFTKELVKNLVIKSPVPIIIDADGINSIIENINVLMDTKAQVILTPHPAELSRLCGVSISESIENRLELAIQLSKKYGVTVIAKGAGTFISDSNGKDVFLTTYGNTSLSKGGSGDILSGIVSSLVAQGTTPKDACVCGSIILGKVAELLSETMSERGIVGTDIIKKLPYVFKNLNI